jgi:hypothetical protein
MHYTTLPHGDQIFTHIDEDTGVQTVFAVDRIRNHMELLGDRRFILQAPIEKRMVDLIQTRRGVEPPRIRRALKTKEWKYLLYLHMPDHTHLLIDGSHTYIAMWMKGRTWSLAYVVPPRIWRQYIVEGIPQWASEHDLLNSHSGCKL